MKRRTFMTAAAAAPVAGCATIQKWLSNPAVAAGIADAIDIAAGVVFHSLGANATSVAQEILAVINTLIGLAKNDQTTVANLGNDAVNIINGSNLNADVKAALLNIVGFAAGALETGTSSLSAQTSANLVTVFTDIQNAAQLFLQGANSQKGKAVLRLAMRMEAPGTGITDSSGHGVSAH